MKFAMRFEGGEQLARALNQLPVRVGKSVLRETLRTVGAPPIQAAAAAKAPTDPGAPDIANHIVVSTGRAAAGPSAAILIGPSTEARTDQPSRTYDRQGVYVEFGTSDTPMQAFMRPAFDSDAVRTLGPIGAALWRALISKGISTRAAPEGAGLD